MCNNRDSRIVLGNCPVIDVSLVGAATLPVGRQNFEHHTAALKSPLSFIGGPDTRLEVFLGFWPAAYNGEMLPVLPDIYSPGLVPIPPELQLPETSMGSAPPGAALGLVAAGEAAAKSHS